MSEMSERVEELFIMKLVKQTFPFHNFYSRPKIKRSGKMEDNAKPMHKKRKHMLGSPNKSYPLS